MSVLTDLNNEQLIEEIKNHPELWKVFHDKYNDKTVKSYSWQRICRKLYPNVKDNSDEESNKIAIIQRRWKSVRDYYTKQCKEPLAKRQKYMYFESLTFLDDRLVPMAAVEELKEEYDEKVEVEDHSLALLNSAIPQKQPQENQIKTENEEISEPSTPEPPTLLQTTASRLDEDELFLLSILPSIRKLTPLQKMDFKLEVMNSLKNIQFSES